MNTRSFPLSRVITGFVTRVAQRVALMEQELLTLPKHLNSTPVFSGVRVRYYVTVNEVMVATVKLSK
jgi:hypothetical protein